MCNCVVSVVSCKLYDIFDTCVHHSSSQVRVIEVNISDDQFKFCLYNISDSASASTTYTPQSVASTSSNCDDVGRSLRTICCCATCFSSLYLLVST